MFGLPPPPPPFLVCAPAVSGLRMFSAPVAVGHGAFGWPTCPALGLQPCVVLRRWLWCPVFLLCPAPPHPGSGLIWFLPWLPWVLVGCFLVVLPPAPWLQPCVIPVLGSLRLAALQVVFLMSSPPLAKALCGSASGCAGPLRAVFWLSPPFLTGRHLCVAPAPDVLDLGAAMGGFLAVPQPPLGVIPRWVGRLPSCVVARFFSSSCCAFCVVPSRLGLLCILLLFLLRRCAVLMAPLVVILCEFAESPAPLSLLCCVLLNCVLARFAVSVALCCAWLVCLFLAVALHRVVLFCVVSCSLALLFPVLPAVMLAGLPLEWCAGAVPLPVPGSCSSCCAVFCVLLRGAAVCCGLFCVVCAVVLCYALPCWCAGTLLCC